ncbi:MAG: hypothetical protein DWQ05_10220 [Calditrichaeota bacterium]|nr:MAG: hypothetical protein DWQ05_10220 [Calditrichota bacterium]
MNNYPSPKINRRASLTCSIILIAIVGNVFAQPKIQKSVYERFFKIYDESTLKVYSTVEKQGLPKLSIKPDALPVERLFSTEFATTLSINENYKTGSGDQLGIYISGKIEREYHPTIQPDGRIYLPTIGYAKISGLKPELAKKAITILIEKRLTNIVVDIHIERPRFLQIQVVGEVYQPGIYTVPAGFDLLSLLHMAHGFLPTANIRNIEVVFADGRISSFDLNANLYQKKAIPPRLYADAKIVIKPQTEWFAIDGAVPIPGLYQFDERKKMRLMDGLQWAGTNKQIMEDQSIFINRLKNDAREFLHISGSKLNETEIQSGDIITLVPMQRADKIYIHIEGEVRNPGTFLWAQGMHLSDGLRMAGGLTGRADSLKGNLTFVNFKSDDIYLDINPGAALKNPRLEFDPLLVGETSIFIRKNNLWADEEFVTVRGEVIHGGQFSIEKNKTRLHEIINRAGGITKFAQKDGIRILRDLPNLFSRQDAQRFDQVSPLQISKQEYSQLLLANDLRKLENFTFDDASLFNSVAVDENPLLKKGDIIFVPEMTDLIYVAGRVGRPGAVSFRQKQQCAYYIEKAGGFIWDADKSNTKIIRMTGAIVNQDKVKKLAPGDIIWVPTKRGKGFWASFREMATVASQLATIFFIIDRTRKE